VLHRTIQINHQPNATVFQFIILTFIYSSTRFGRFSAHHQELSDCSGSLWFYLRIAVTVVMCSWSGQPAGPRPAGPTTNTSRLSSTIHPSIYGTTAPSGPWPPSQDASIHLYSQLFSSTLLSPAVVVHPSEPHPSI
jgi:hypothetical protein